VPLKRLVSGYFVGAAAFTSFVHASGSAART
jgi:hypothetical protein